MRQLAKRAYRKLRRIPLLGRMLDGIAPLFRKPPTTSDAPSADVSSLAIGVDPEWSHAIVERIAILEQRLPGVDNYIASWADTVAMLRREQDALRQEINILRAEKTRDS